MAIPVSSLQRLNVLGRFLKCMSFVVMTRSVTPSTVSRESKQTVVVITGGSGLEFICRD